jgi:hypothetical protein
MGLFIGCTSKKTTTPRLHDFWSTRTIPHQHVDSLYHASSYLSVYSEIYSNKEKTTHKLTVTIGMRNISSKDTVYILGADYYDTQGSLIKTYFEHPIYILPLETAELVLSENDEGGGTGGNFIFEWASANSTIEPLFEAVMISTSGQQGISFVTQGVKR